jgi:hypothetical protein
MKRFFQFLLFAFVSAALSGCTAGAIYERSRTYNKTIEFDYQLANSSVKRIIVRGNGGE